MRRPGRGRARLGEPPPADSASPCPQFRAGLGSSRAACFRFGAGFPDTVPWCFPIASCWSFLVGGTSRPPGAAASSAGSGQLSQLKLSSDSGEDWSQGPWTLCPLRASPLAFFHGELLSPHPLSRRQCVGSAWSPTTCEAAWVRVFRLFAPTESEFFCGSVNETCRREIIL